MSPSISRESESTPTTVNVPDSRQQPAWHVIVLGVFATPPIYVAYWGYKTLRDLKRESIEVNGPIDDPRAQAAGIKPAKPAPLPPRNCEVKPDQHLKDSLATFGALSPFLRGLGMLIPLFNVYPLTTLIIGVTKLVPDESSYPRKHPLIATGCVLGAFLALVALARLPGLLWMPSLLGLIPIAVAQHWLNKYWAHVESPDVLVRHGFSFGEMLVIILGAGLQGLVVAGFMIGVK